MALKHPLTLFIFRFILQFTRLKKGWEKAYLFLEWILGKMDPVKISNELYILKYTALMLEIEP